MTDTIATSQGSTTLPTESMIEGAGGVQLGLLDYGEPGSGSAAPLVLLHGIRDLAWSMDSVAVALRDRFHVYSLDLRGHGRSEHPGGYTFQLYAADLHRVLERLGIERVTLVGHSLGGQIVCVYASLFPERVRALVTVEGLGPPRPPLEDEIAEKRAQGRAGIEMLVNLEPRPRRITNLEEGYERVRSNHPGLDEARVRFLTERGTAPLPDGSLRWRWDPRVQGTWTSTSRMANEERWGWITCPTLVITAGRSGAFWRERRGMKEAEDGGMSPAERLRRVACFRDARHVEIADAGHMVHFDAPEELNRAILEFLASVEH